MNTADRMRQTGVVPVVVLDDAKDAVPAAKALLAGGVDVMEMTISTAAAGDAVLVRGFRAGWRGGASAAFFLSRVRGTG